MNKNFKNFTENVERICRVIPEDIDYFREIHENKPLIPELAKLFPEGESRIKIPVTLSGTDNWEERFTTLFAGFYQQEKDNIDFVNWKLKRDKNTIKLTKGITEFYGADYNLLREALGEEFQWIIDNKPSSKSEDYIVLSKDPMDFYMCSTNQAFSSCMRLDGEGFWVGIMNRIADPTCLIAYIPDKNKEAKFVFEGNGPDPSWMKPFELTSQKMLGRSWALFAGNKGGKDEIFLPRFFGTAFKKGSEETSLKFVYKTEYRSDYYRVIRCYEHSPVKTPTAYLDNMTIQTKGANELRNLLNSSYGTSRITLSSQTDFFNMARRV